MTPTELAALHAQCFVVPRPYSETEFAGFLNSSLCFLCQSKHGFALGRAIADEAELLTLAVDPKYRQQGIGKALVHEFERQAKAKGAQSAFLEVAADNSAALALYRSAGFTESGLRSGYYRGTDGVSVDAILMAKPLKPA